MKIQMLDRDEQVREEILKVHACRGGDALCGLGEPARCEECGREASAEVPVYVWNAEDLSYFICKTCLDADAAYARVVLGDNACVDHGLDFSSPAELMDHLHTEH